MPHNTAALEGKLHGIHESLTTLTAARHAETVASFVRRPGWTTPAEALLVEALIDNIQSQINDLASAQRALVSAADKIGSE